MCVSGDHVLVNFAYYTILIIQSVYDHTFSDSGMGEKCTQSISLLTAVSIFFVLIKYFIKLMSLINFFFAVKP